MPGTPPAKDQSGSPALSVLCSQLDTIGWVGHRDQRRIRVHALECFLNCVERTTRVVADLDDRTISQRDRAPPM